MKKSATKKTAETAGSAQWLARPGIIAFVLLAATVGLFYPVGQFQFLNYDDPDYVTDNLVVRAGLS